MNISVCITVYNEEGSIIKTLDSIINGTLKPFEIIVVDGGSTDNTCEIIKKYSLKNKLVKLFIGKGSVAKGRNYSINKAKGEIIVQTDAGCIVKKDWLEKITEPFKRNKSVDIVAGFYEMPAKTALQAAINVFHGTPPERFDNSAYIPSARSVALKKSVWRNIGGYNEKLKGTGEDTLFFYKAVKNNFKIERVGEARVIWQETYDLSYFKFLKKLFNYAKGDAVIGIWWDPSKHFESHNIKILLIFIRYFVALALVILAFFGYIPPLLILFLGILYLIWPVLKWRDVIKTAKGKFLLPLIQISSDLAVMAGFIRGILESRWAI